MNPESIFLQLARVYGTKFTVEKSKEMVDLWGGDLAPLDGGGGIPRKTCLDKTLIDSPVYSSGCHDDGSQGRTLAMSMSELELSVSFRCSIFT